MRKKIEKLNPGVVFGVTLIIFLVPLLYYIFYYVPNKQSMLTERYMKSLAMMSDQFETRGKNIGEVIKSHCDLFTSENKEKMFVINKEIPSEKKIESNPLIFPFKRISSKFFLKPGEGNKDIQATLDRLDPKSWMNLLENMKMEKKSYRYEPQKKQFEIELLLNKTKNGKETDQKPDIWGKLTGCLKIRNFLENICTDEDFDEILFFDKEGKVVFNLNKLKEEGLKRGIRLINLPEIQDIYYKNKEKKNNNQESQNGKTDDKSIKSYSQVHELNIAGESYRLFLQPISFDFLDNWNENDHLFIGGMVKEETFQAKSRQISKNVLLVFVISLFILLVVYPLLRFWFVGKKDRLKQRDICFLLLSLVFGVPLIVYFILTFSIFQIQEENYSENLRYLADNIHNNFTHEIEMAREQLNRLTDKINYLGYKKELLKELEKKNTDLIYPFFKLAFVMNPKGMQILKSVSGKTFIVLHDVSHREYFKKIRDKEYWYSESGHPIMLEPLYSKTDGKYELELSLPYMIRHTLDISDLITAIAISFRPVSVMKPVLPYGYRFAVITNEGKVIFHSNSWLNLNENLFTECDQEDRIRSAIYSRSECHISTSSYQGIKRELFIKPISNIPWTIVTFRDRELGGAKNLQLLSMTWMQYLFYILVLAVFCGSTLVFSYFQKPALKPGDHLFHFKFRWVWPDSRLRGVYEKIAILNAVSILVFIILLFIFQTIPLFILIIPSIIVTLVYLIIIKYSMIQNSRESKQPYSPLKFIRNSQVSWCFFILLGVIVWYFRKSLFNGFGWRHSLVFIPLFLYILYLFFLSKIKIKNPNSNTNWFQKNSYELVLFTLFSILIILPALCIYKHTYKKVNEVALKQEQLELARNYVEWEKRFIEEFEHQSELIRKSSQLKKYIILAADLGVYKHPFLSIKRWSELSELESEQPFSFRYLLQYIKLKYYENLIIFPIEFYCIMMEKISKLIPFSNKYQVNTRLLFKDYSDDSNFSPSLYWIKTKSGDKNSIDFQYHEGWNMFKYNYKKSDPDTDALYIFSVIPGIIWNKKNKVILVFTIFLLLMFLIVILFTLLRFLKKAIFLDYGYDLHEGDPLFYDPEVNLKDNSFILGKGEPVKRKDYHSLDLANEGGLEDVKTEDLKKGMPIIITNFDYNMYDPVENLKKLELLERLIFFKHMKVLVFSQFEPLGYFSFQKNEIEGSNKKKGDKDNEKKQNTKVLDIQVIKSRWIRVMRHFNFLYVDPGNEIIENEKLDYLKYERTWRTCSKEEKLVLVQLAQEGFLNYKNKKVIEKLVRRNLIKLSPLRLINKDFKDFVNSAEDLDSILTWEKGKHGSSWKNVRRPVLFLLTGIALFLVITQPQVLKYWLILIPAITGGIPAVLKIFNQFSAETSGNN